MARECSTCERKVKYCVCENAHANPGRVHLPLPADGRGRSRRVDDAEHRARCRAQGYRGLSTW